MLEQLTYLADAYGYMKAGKSKQEALAWLHTKVPPQMYNPFSEACYDQEQVDLLWDFIDKPYPGEGMNLSGSFVLLH
ncbi:MAG: hypothetical protein M0018_01475 [Nitrospiraceae bacterium]|nr:hypothetical protein [Nitrospiraceae bacterium]